MEIKTPRQSINKAYLKENPVENEMRGFAQSLQEYLNTLNEQESEEHHKKFITQLLDNSGYGTDYYIMLKQEDSLICAKFLRIDEKRPFSHQVYHKYIFRIRPGSLPEDLLVELNQTAINEGLEDIEKKRRDSTVVESDIPYPTNNSLIGDCINISQNHLKSLAKEINEVSFRDYTKAAKKIDFKICLT